MTLLPPGGWVFTIFVMHRKPPAAKPTSPAAFAAIAALFVVGAVSVELLDDSKDVAAGQSSESLVERIRQNVRSPEQRQALSQTLGQASPAQLRALVAQASPEQLKALAAQASPEQLKVLATQASREQMHEFGEAASVPMSIDRSNLAHRTRTADDSPAIPSDKLLTSSALQRPSATPSVTTTDDTGLKADLEEIVLTRAVSFDNSPPPDAQDTEASFCGTRRRLEDLAWQAQLVGDRTHARHFRRPPSFQLATDCDA